MLINLVNLKFCSIKEQEGNVKELNITFKTFKFLLITRLMSFKFIYQSLIHVNSAAAALIRDLQIQFSRRS